MREGNSPPTAITLDTSVLVAATIEGLTHWQASAAFCTRLVDTGSHIHFSAIVRLELSQVLARLPHDAQLPASLRRAYRLERWDRNAAVRERWLRFGVQEFEALVARFARVSEIPFSRAIWAASLDVMAQHQLRSHDAVHVATARAAGVRDFATLDDHFRRVPDLRLWLLRPAT